MNLKFKVGDIVWGMFMSTAPARELFIVIGRDERTTYRFKLVHVQTCREVYNHEVEMSLCDDLREIMKARVFFEEYKESLHGILAGLHAKV